jgi:hypothetical protein
MKKQTKNKDVLYVQLGKRRNGRIVKAENYDLDNFLDKCMEVLNPKIIMLPNLSWYDKVFKTKKFLTHERIYHGHRINLLYKAAIKTGMKELIKRDDFGRKKK